MIPLRFPVTPSPPRPRIIDLGRLPYEAAYQAQQSHVNAVLSSRASAAPEIGRILFVEHDPVITISRRPGARNHLLASPETLARLGVRLAETDRGGDITYHGPGQLVVYPILDLNALNLGLHAYMRLLESAVIDACAHWGIPGQRDPSATGVWVDRAGTTSKIAAMGVRVQKWVSMHGLAINIDPDMSHFNLIVPCGLAGRTVTSARAELTGSDRPPPTMDEARRVLEQHLTAHIMAAATTASRARAAAQVTDIPPRTG